MRDYFLQIYNNHPSPDRIAVIGSGYIDINYPAPADNSSSDGALWKDMKRVITSGSLLSIDAYDRLGQFQEEFFIDMVDREYCYRARENGFIVIQTTRPLIAHSIGAYKGHNFIGMEVWTSNHSALRRYFITRNRLLVQRKYQRVNYFWRATSLLKVIRKCISVCLYESHKIAKVRAMLAGWWHGVNGVLTPPLWIRRQVGYVWKNPG